jgi:predicted nucleic acid-binding protein
LIDTNVLSELRKGERCHPNVARWYESLSTEEIFLSVLALGEIRSGIERIRRRGDAKSVRALEAWLRALATHHADRILPIDQAVAEEWGRLSVPDPVPVIDGLMAATARVHDLTLATRNLKDTERTGVACLNPFDDRG